MKRTKKELTLRTPEEMIDDIMLPIFILTVMFAMVAFCYVTCFPSAVNLEEQNRFNKATKVFNELSLEQRKVICDDLLGDVGHLDKTVYLFTERDEYPHTLREAWLRFLIYLYVVSAICFLTYCAYCFEDHHRLADHPYPKPFNYLILAVFAIAGWPFFLKSRQRVKEDRKRALTQTVATTEA